MRSQVANVWQHRTLLSHLVRRDLKLRYEVTTLGYIWSLLEPLLLTVIYFFVFSLVGRFGVDDYPLFLLSAILPWIWVSTAANASSRALLSESRLITRIYLPRETFPVSVATSKGIEYILSLPAVALVALVLTHPPTIYVTLLPVALLMQWILVTGLALGLSALNTLFRDVERSLRVTLRALFYLSPIVYPFDRIPNETFAGILAAVNPLVGLIGLYRSFWFADSFPGWGILSWSFGLSIALFFFGAWMFATLESDVLKEL